MLPSEVTPTKSFAGASGYGKCPSRLSGVAAAVALGLVAGLATDCRRRRRTHWCWVLLSLLCLTGGWEQVKVEVQPDADPTGYCGRTLAVSKSALFSWTDSAVLLGMGGLALLLEFRRRQQAPRLAGVFLTD